MKAFTLKLPQQWSLSEEWIANGCQLGWLFYPRVEEVLVYRPKQPVAHFAGYQQSISGDPVLPGFTFDLAWLR